MIKCDLEKIIESNRDVLIKNGFKNINTPLTIDEVCKFVRKSAYGLVDIANNFNFKTWKDLVNLDEFNEPNNLDEIKKKVPKIISYLLLSHEIRGSENEITDEKYNKIYEVYEDLKSIDIIDYIVSNLSTIQNLITFNSIVNSFDDHIVIDDEAKEVLEYNIYRINDVVESSILLLWILVNRFYKDSDELNEYLKLYGYEGL